MITRNGKIAISSVIADKSVTGDEIRLLDGTYAAYDKKIDPTDWSLNYAYLNDSQRGLKMRLGVGSTEPTVDDYCLEQIIVDDVDINSIITCQSATLSRTTDGGVLYTYTFRNNSFNAKQVYTIKEIGIYDTVFGLNRTMLFARMVIPPRTIKPGESASFTYELAYN